MIINKTVKGTAKKRVTISESPTNTLGLFHMLFGTPVVGKKYSAILVSSANESLYNLVHALCASVTSSFDTQLSVGAALRYRDGSFATTLINTAYDAANTVGDVYEVIESEDE